MPPAVLHRPAVWLAGLILWAAVLCFLSSRPAMGPVVHVDHIDKILHFGYFLGGGFLFAGWRLPRGPSPPAWSRIIITTILAMAAIGLLDELHQLRTPGRSGGDPWDWLADLLGGAAGAFLLKAASRIAKP